MTRAKPRFQFPADVPGYATPATAEALYQLALQVRDGDWVVELGTFYGHGTICLAQGLAAHAAAREALGLSTTQGPRLMTIDHYMGEPDVGDWDHATGSYTKEDVEANLLRYGFTATVVEGRSWEIPEAWWRRGERVGLLFIDAAHDEESAYRDFAVWETPMAEHGIIAFDDFNFPGVAAAVDRACKTERWCIRETMADDRIVVLTRR